MAATEAAENHGDGWDLIWYLSWEIYKSIPTWTHLQNSVAAGETLSVKIYSHGTSPKWSQNYRNQHKNSHKPRDEAGHPVLSLLESHVWAGGSSWYLELLDKLQKRICRTVGCLLATSLQPLALAQNMFFRTDSTSSTSFLLREVHLLFWWIVDFSLTIPKCYKDVYLNSFFSCTARLWDSWPIECFPLTYDLNGFKSRVNRHLLTVGSF